MFYSDLSSSKLGRSSILYCHPREGGDPVYFSFQKFVFRKRHIFLLENCLTLGSPACASFSKQTFPGAWGAQYQRIQKPAVLGGLPCWAVESSLAGMIPLWGFLRVIWPADDDHVCAPKWHPSEQCDAERIAGVHQDKCQAVQQHHHHDDAGDGFVNTDNNGKVHGNLQFSTGQFQSKLFILLHTFIILSIVNELIFKGFRRSVLVFLIKTQEKFVWRNSRSRVGESEVIF